ncbi:MAG: FIMAH domain-containing protein [Candidatus Levyibacteriota bacterium]
MLSLQWKINKIVSLFLFVIFFGVCFTHPVAAANSKIIFSDCPFSGFCNVNSDIDVINPDGSNVTKIGSGNFPEFSPDGTKIVFAAAMTTACVSLMPGQHTRWDIYTMNTDGTNIQNLTASQPCSNSIAPQWSPDGTKVVFMQSPFLNGSAGVYVINADGSNVTQLIAGGEYPVWSPDGTKIAYTAGAGRAPLHVINIDGSNDQNLGVFVNNFQPAWSPNGTEIAYIDNGQNGDFLNEVKPDGTGQKTFYLPPTGSNIWGLSWSPDGSQVALCMAIPNPFGRTNIYTLPATGGSATQIYNSTGNGCKSVSWGQIIPPNQPPVLQPISNRTIYEGDTYAVNSSFVDSDSTSWTATVDYGDGSGIQSLPLSALTFSLQHVYSVAGTFSVTVRIIDNQGATGMQTATIIVLVPTTASIKQTINQMYANGSITKLGSSLSSKLDQAQSAITTGNYAQARRILQSLINQIQAQSGNQITADAANILINQIQYLINSLPQ